MRWSWFLDAALSALMPSGVNTISAIRTPLSATGAPSASISAVDDLVQALGEQHDRQRAGDQQRDPLGDRAALSSGTSCSSVAPCMNRSRCRPVWIRRKITYRTIVAPANRIACVVLSVAASVEVVTLGQDQRDRDQRDDHAQERARPGQAVVLRVVLEAADHERQADRRR